MNRLSNFRNHYDAATDHQTTFVFDLSCSTGWDFVHNLPGKSGTLGIALEDGNQVSGPAGVFSSLSTSINDLDCSKVERHDDVLEIKLRLPAQFAFDDFGTGVHTFQTVTMLIDLTFKHSETPDLAGSRSFNGNTFTFEEWAPTPPHYDIVITGFIGIEGKHNYLVPPDADDSSTWLEQKGRIVDPRFCTPDTCAQAGVPCGIAPDGCGGFVECANTCAAPQECNLDTSTCCTPLSCAALGKQCGFASNNCDNQIDCGTCSPGNECQADNTCAPASPIPK